MSGKLTNSPKRSFVSAALWSAFLRDVKGIQTNVARLGLAASIALAGCADGPDESKGTVTVSPKKTVDAPGGRASPAGDLPPSPQPALSRQAVASPPLPPELEDDGGLIPLPARPSATQLAEQAGQETNKRN